MTLDVYVVLFVGDVTAVIYWWFVSWHHGSRTEGTFWQIWLY